MYIKDVKVKELINTKKFIFEEYDIKLGDEIYNLIYNKSYVENEDICLNDLKYIKLVHYNYEKRIQVGELIVNKKITKQVKNIFKYLFEIEYEINSMVLIDRLWVNNSNDSDRNSVLNNNSSCFCYRKVITSNNLSKHALGLAIDINPYDNPFVPRNKEGKLDSSYLTLYEKEMLIDRQKKSKTNKHIITLNDEICKIFIKNGFEYGGDWPNYSDEWPLDYQHFEYIL